MPEVHQIFRLGAFFVLSHKSFDPERVSFLTGKRFVLRKSSLRKFRIGLVYWKKLKKAHMSGIFEKGK